MHLTWFGSKDLLFGETGHQAPADGSCACQTDRESPCDPPEGTFPLGLLHIQNLGRTQAAPVYSAGNARACVPTVSQEQVFTKRWSALAKAGITLPKLPVLQQQKGSQSYCSSGLSQVSPAFSE